MTFTLPDSLEMSTADRLRLVADIICRFPEKWDQGSFYTYEYLDRLGLDLADFSLTNPHEMGGHLAEAIRCDTVGCLAGWAVACTPRDRFDSRLNWSDSGAIAFGLDHRLAFALFHDWYAYGLDSADGPEPFAAVLRGLAEMPEPRTLAAAIAAGVLTPDEDEDDWDE